MPNELTNQIGDTIDSDLSKVSREKKVSKLLKRKFAQSKAIEDVQGSAVSIAKQKEELVDYNAARERIKNINLERKVSLSFIELSMNQPATYLF